jgi:hypothetical protein
MDSFFLKINKKTSQFKANLNLKSFNNSRFNNTLILGNVNEYFEKYLVESDEIHFLLTKKPYLFDYGIIINYNKISKVIDIYTDPYGISSNYYLDLKEEFIISNSIELIKKEINTFNPNLEAVADYFIFNYPIQGRTYIEGIYKMTAGQNFKITEGQIHYNEYIDWDNMGSWDFCNDENPEKIFSDVIKEKHIPSVPILLGLSGGFDSKTVLAGVLKNNINFKAFTFGDDNHPDVISAKKTSELIGFKWIQNDFGTKSIEELKKAYLSFVDANQNLAFPPTIMNYVFVNEFFGKSQIFTGKMGGEILVGPSLISNIVMSSAAYKILSQENSNSILNEIKNLDYIHAIFKCEEKIHNYSQKLKILKKDKNKLNELKFLMTEAYPNFFGQINCVLPNHILTNPFTDLRFIKSLFDRELLFNNHNMTLTSRMKARIYYFHLVRKLNMKILKTPLDRGISLNSFNPKYLFLYPALNFIKRKTFIKKNKKIENKLFEFLASDAVFFFDKLEISNHEFRELVDYFVSDRKFKRKISIQDKINFIKLKVLFLQAEQTN